MQTAEGEGHQAKSQKSGACSVNDCTSQGLGMNHLMGCGGLGTWTWL